MDWGNRPGEGYSDLEELYEQVFVQMGRYTRHVSTQIGGVYDHPKNNDQEGAVFTPVPRHIQEGAVSFLHREVFQTPSWMIDTMILRRIEATGIQDRILKLQRNALTTLFRQPRLDRLYATQITGTENAYELAVLFRSLTTGIFSELPDRRQPDIFRRNLQRELIDQFGELVQRMDDHTDASALARQQLEVIMTLSKKASRRGGGG